MKKNKVYVSFFLGLILIISCSSEMKRNIPPQKDKFKTIELKEFYDTQGVIIPKEKVLFRPDVSKFTPSIDEITSAEIIMNSKIKKLEFSDSAEIDRSLIDLKIYKKNYQEYYRQYSGYISKNKERIIVIKLLKIDDDELLEYWMKEDFWAHGNYYDKYFRTFYIDIKDKKLFLNSR